MGKYNIGEVWWTHFPFQEKDIEKHRPAIVIDEDTIAILTLYVTSQNKENPYSIEITDWKEAGLSKQSWARIDRIIRMDEWRMDRKIGNLSRKDLLKIMQLVAEITGNIVHEFSLAAIKNIEGKYLQLYDERWKGWLFPYFRTTDNNKQNVDERLTELLQMKICTQYVTAADHCKYSVSDEVYKHYHHKLYFVTLENMPELFTQDKFVIGDSKFKWMTMEQMEQDDKIMEQNDDIVAFVKRKCS